MALQKAFATNLICGAVGFQRIVADPLRSFEDEPAHIRELIHAVGRKNRYAVAADRAGRSEPGETVDEPRLEQNGRKRATALYQQTCQTARRQRLQYGEGFRMMIRARCDLDEFDTERRILLVTLRHGFR